MERMQSLAGASASSARDLLELGRRQAGPLSAFRHGVWVVSHASTELLAQGGSMSNRNINKYT